MDPIESGKTLLAHVAETVSKRAKFALPNLVRGSVLLFLGVIFIVFSIGWFSVLGWERLRLAMPEDGAASAVLGGGFLISAVLFLVVGRRSGVAALEAPASDAMGSDDENSMSSELTAFSEDVGRMARKALDPREVLYKNSGKIILVSALIGVMVGIRVKEPKRRKK